MKPAPRSLGSIPRGIVPVFVCWGTSAAANRPRPTRRASRDVGPLGSGFLVWGNLDPYEACRGRRVNQELPITWPFGGV
jgi:hypothetical protein